MNSNHASGESRETRRCCAQVRASNSQLIPRVLVTLIIVLNDITQETLGNQIPDGEGHLAVGLAAVGDDLAIAVVDQNPGAVDDYLLSIFVMPHSLKREQILWWVY